LGCPWGTVGLLVVGQALIGSGRGSGGSGARQRTARRARRRVPKAGGDAPAASPGLVMPWPFTFWGEGYRGLGSEAAKAVVEIDEEGLEGEGGRS
jgi:hypothetical protein